MAKWIKLQSSAGQKGGKREIEVGTREKTKAVMLRKEGLSWRAHPRTNTASPHRQGEKSSLESHHWGGETGRERERALNSLPPRTLFIHSTAEKEQRKP